MSPLRELQVGFRAVLLGGDDARVAGEIADDGIRAAARVAIYRHHVFTSLTVALEATYPVVTRLVDRRFFGWVADGYIRAHPPAGPCLFEYGAQLPDYLAAFPACADLPWLADVARLEWAMNVALHAPDAEPLGADAWRALDAAALARLTVRVDPSITLLASPWPVDAIWRANQPDGDGVVDLDRGAVQLQVQRVGDDVVLRALGPAAFAFRSALAAGASLQDATEQTFEIDPGCALVDEIRAVRDEQMLVAG